MVVGLFIAAVIISFATNGGKGAPVAAKTPTPSYQPTTAATSAAGSPSSSSGANLTGPPGTTYTVTGDNGPNDSTTTYSVAMVQAVQHATLSQYDTLTNGNAHVTAAEFKITGMSGQTSDDADSDAVVVGTDGQDYTPAFDQITEGTNFNDGEFQVGPGDSLQDITQRNAQRLTQPQRGRQGTLGGSRPECTAGCSARLDLPALPPASEQSSPAPRGSDRGHASRAGVRPTASPVVVVRNLVHRTGPSCPSLGARWTSPMDQRPESARRPPRDSTAAATSTTPA